MSEHQLEVMLGRLRAHRMSTHETHVFLVDTRRRKLGTLDQIEMSKLKTKIMRSLVKQKSIGIHLVDTSKGGAMQKPGLYRHQMQDFVQSL